jgi:hypothetical protein
LIWSSRNTRRSATRAKGSQQGGLAEGVICYPFACCNKAAGYGFA